MKYSNEITEAQLWLGPRSLNRTHLTSAVVAVVVLSFGAVASMEEIVWLHTVLLDY